MTSASPRFNLYQRSVRRLIAGLFSGVLIPAFSRYYGTANSQAQLRRLQRLPVGTVGRAVAELLATHGLQLIPGYESHDLKHVLLGCDMTPDDELKIKAFMLGNGDWSLASIVLSLLGLLTPEKWPVLWQCYRQGRRTPSIVQWQLAHYATHDLRHLRRQLGLAGVPGSVL